MRYPNEAAVVKARQVLQLLLSIQQEGFHQELASVDLEPLEQLLFPTETVTVYPANPIFEIQKEIEEIQQDLVGVGFKLQVQEQLLSDLETQRKELIEGLLRKKLQLEALAPLSDLERALLTEAGEQAGLHVPDSRSKADRSCARDLYRKGFLECESLSFFRISEQGREKLRESESTR